MPLVHLDIDYDDATDDLDDAAVQEKRRRAQLSPKVRALEDAVTKAVADGDPPVLVNRAQRRLDKALEEEALKHKAERQRRAAESAKAAAERKVKADAIEKSLRAQGPYCEFVAGGRRIRIELQNPEPTVRAFAVEAVKRVAQQAANGFEMKARASRQRGAEVAEADWLSQMLNSSAGLLHAVKHAPADRRWGARPRETCSRAASAIW